MKRLKAKEWTDEEVRVLTTMARQKSTACEIASALGRHIASVKRMSNEFCLPLARKQTSVTASRAKTLRRSRFRFALESRRSESAADVLETGCSAMIPRGTNHADSLDYQTPLTVYNPTTAACDGERARSLLEDN